MKQDLCDVVFVLDRSGSMESVKSDTIGGFNSFIDAQQKLPGECAVTLTQFDTQYEVVYAGKPVKEAPKLDDKTFVPRGSTALLDAIGRTINETGARLAAIPEADRPGKVIFVILTDGHENASKEFKREQIFQMISLQRDTYKWEFVFLGANQDAIQAGASMGIGAASSMTYAANSEGTQVAMAAVSGYVGRSRAGGQAAFTQQDRDAQKKAGAGTP